MYIQILTLNIKNKKSRIMIEQHNDNRYAVQIDTKINKEKFYNGFQYILNNSRRIKEFETAQNAFSYVVNEFFKDPIISIDNEISCLLKVEEIKNISNVNKIINV